MRKELRIATALAALLAAAPALGQNTQQPGAPPAGGKETAPPPTPQAGGEPAQLENAPPFESVAERRAAEQAERAARTPPVPATGAGTGAGGAVVPAPVPGAPAAPGAAPAQ